MVIVGSNKGTVIERQRGVSNERTRTYLKFLPLGLLLACIALGGVVSVLMYERGQRARLAARMAKLKSEGGAADDLSLAAVYNAKTSVQMLYQWEKVFALAKALDKSTASGSDQEILQLLAPLRAEVAIAVEADSPCRFIEKFEAVHTLLPHAGEMRKTTTLLCSHAQAALNTNDVSAALQDCELIQGCSRAISADPGVNAQLTSMALQRRANEVYRKCLEQDALSERLSETQLEAIIDNCRLLAPIGDSWSFAISGERAMVLALMTDHDYEESLAVHDPYFHWSGLRGKGANNLVDLFEKIEAVPVDDLQAMNQELTNVQDSWEGLKDGLLANFENRVAPELIGDFQRIGIRFIYLSMQYRTTAIAAALRLYHKRFGEFPASLEELESVGMKPRELRTFSDSAFDYRRSTSNARFFDYNQEWREIVPPEAADSEWILNAK